MSTKIAVMGAGPGGYIAAIRAAQKGAEVTVIEKENVGGTCLNHGCIPSKIMITTGEMIEKFRKAGQFGIDVQGEFQVNMKSLMARKEKIIDTQSKGILGLFDHHKITYIKGHGKITGPGNIEVRQEDGNVETVNWDKLILSTGTQPFEIPVFPFDGEKILSSNHALSLDEIPKSILIVGGGVIGCEFAFILNALGSKVTVVEALDRLLPLPSVDTDCSKILQREMKKRKIKFIVDKTVDSVQKTDDGLDITIGPSPFKKDIKEKDKKPVNVKAEKMLVSIGRKPNSSDIGLENIGLTPDERGWIAANEKMETNVANVYAIGDILGPEKIMLAHVASTEGIVAAENATGGDKTMAYDVVPSAIFTSPEVATVGLSEAQAKEAGHDYRADAVLFRTVGKAQVIGDIAGQAKIISDKTTNKILGVHMIGPHVTDLIAETTLAMKTGATTTDLANTIHAHPTLAEITLETAFKSLDQSLHG